MSWLGDVWERLRSVLTFGLLKKRPRYTLGIYGAPNAGKTMLANRMCDDWKVDAMGSVSDVPHETRNVERRTVVLQNDEHELKLEVMDTPGLSSSVSPLELEVLWSIPPEEARQRAKEATDGIMEAIRNLETVNGMLLVVDGSIDPATQVSETLVAHVRGRGLPHVVIANKSDLSSFSVDAVRKVFPQSVVVPVSALDGTNIDAFYEALFATFR